MEIQIRRSEERGHADHGWLRSFHTFSFADYHDPEFMGFRALRVINEDFVEPARGFPTHPHRDMEIVTYVLDGALEHKDSMGTGSVIRPGDVQRMSAGTGVTHSEFNASRDQSVHLLQIWILPDRRNYPPSYEQKAFSPEERRDRFRLIAANDGRDGAVSLHQDVALYASLLSEGRTVEQPLTPGRFGFLHVARGEIDLNGELLRSGDAAAIANAERLSVVGRKDSELLFFDLS